MSQACRASEVSYITFTRAERSAYSLPADVPPSREIGCPAAIRRSAKLGIRLQVLRARAFGSIWTIAVHGVARRSHSRPSICSGLIVIVHGPIGLSEKLFTSCALYTSI